MKLTHLPFASGFVLSFLLHCWLPGPWHFPPLVFSFLLLVLISPVYPLCPAYPCSCLTIGHSLLLGPLGVLDRYSDSFTEWSKRSINKATHFKTIFPNKTWYFKLKKKKSSEGCGDGSAVVPEEDLHFPLGVHITCLPPPAPTDICTLSLVYIHIWRESVGRKRKKCSPYTINQKQITTRGKCSGTLVSALVPEFQGELANEAWQWTRVVLVFWASYLVQVFGWVLLKHRRPQKETLPLESHWRLFYGIWKYFIRRAQNWESQSFAHSNTNNSTRLPPVGGLFSLLPPGASTSLSSCLSLQSARITSFCLNRSHFNQATCSRMPRSFQSPTWAASQPMTDDVRPFGGSSMVPAWESKLRNHVQKVPCIFCTMYIILSTLFTISTQIRLIPDSINN